MTRPSRPLPQSPDVIPALGNHLALEGGGQGGEQGTLGKRTTSPKAASNFSCNRRKTPIRLCSWMIYTSTGKAQFRNWPNPGLGKLFCLC